MPTLTKEMWQKCRAACPENWHFDAQTYIMRGEKEIYTDSKEAENGSFYRLTLGYAEERTGTGWTAKRTGRQIPTANVSRYSKTHTEGFYSVVHIFSEPCGDAQSKKNYAALVKIAAVLDAESYFLRAVEKDTGKAYNDLSDFFGATEAPAEPEVEEEPAETAAAAEAEYTTEPETEAAEAVTEEPADDPAPVQSEETEQTQEEPEEPAADEKPVKPADNFAALAAAYISGKTIKPKKTPQAPKPEKEPEPEPEPETEPEPAPEPPGFRPNGNATLTEETRQRLAHGETVTVDGGHSWHDHYFTAQKSASVRFVYCSGTYGDTVTIQPGSKIEFAGVLIGTDYYTGFKAIDEKFTDDINAYLLEKIPTESAAANVAANVENRQRIDAVKAQDYAREARIYFVDSKKPNLTLYSKPSGNIAHEYDELLQYLQQPEKAIEAVALRYMCEFPDEIYLRWIFYSRLSAAIAAIENDKTNTAHTLKRISASIADEKTVKIELKNGNTVRVEASAVKHIDKCDRISDFRVNACDRKYLDKNEYGIAKDIYPDDIVRITHGQRVLYTV